MICLELQNGGRSTRNVLENFICSMNLVLLNPFSVSCSVNAEENGHNALTPQKGISAGDGNINLGISEIPSKPALPSQTGQMLEEQTAAPTPVKKSGKAKQQIDVKAELEKRQGGKQLLNLVVIGTVFRGESLSNIIQIITRLLKYNASNLPCLSDNSQFPSS